MEYLEEIVLEIESGDALLIVPPFGSTNMPYLGVHVLQSCAKKEGFEVRVLYANLLFASLMGEAKYESLCRSPLHCMYGERIFAAAAYELPHLGKDDFASQIREARASCPEGIEGLDADELIHWSKVAVSWVNRMGEAISQLGFRVVGCTTTFEQTAAAVALLSRVKCLSPETITVIGGGNCEGEMAEGFKTLSEEIDYVFSGESERSFPAFLRGTQDEDFSSHHIITGESSSTLDELPLVDFSEFFAQHRLWLKETLIERGDGLWISYETSRGCWWGERRQCTFCGLNGENNGYRQKCAERVVADLRVLTENYATRRVCMTDNNMPFGYYRTLLPRVPEGLPGLSLFCELKTPFSLDAAEALSKVGVSMMQPVVESLSTECLKLMGKPVTAGDTVSLLRHARSTGMGVSWRIVFGVPGDRIGEYGRMLEMIPLLKHLQPPLGLSQLDLDRFSPYLVSPAEYQIAEVRPLEVYGAIFPDTAAVSKLAYHFTASYPSESREANPFMKTLEQAITDWRESWCGSGEVPALALTDIGSGRYALLDTRGIPGTSETTFITEEQAAAAVIGTASSTEAVEWAKEQKLLVEVDGEWIPLVTGDPALQRRLAQTVPVFPETA